MNDEIKIYVYASCHVSEQLDSDEVVGNGGYGIVVSVNGRKVEEISGGFSNTTHKRINIIAINESIKRFGERGSILIYLIDGGIANNLNSGWLDKWKNKGFKKKKKHADLWMELYKLQNSHPNSITFKQASDLRTMPDFQRAEQLAKAMSGKKNLPVDMKKESPINSLFGNDDDSNENVTELDLADDTPIRESICVDAACTTNPGPTEYRGVDTETKKVLFEKKFEEATNNIGEFLAIVHALALCKKEGREIRAVYSDSMTAITWVKKKRFKTTFERTEANKEVFDALERAVEWLESNQCAIKVLKWNTGAWGPIAADYGRK